MLLNLHGDANLGTDGIKIITQYNNHICPFLCNKILVNKSQNIKVKFIKCKIKYIMKFQEVLEGTDHLSFFFRNSKSSKK